MPKNGFWVKQDGEATILKHGEAILCIYSPDGVAIQIHKSIDRNIQLSQIDGFLGVRYELRASNHLSPYTPHNVFLTWDDKEVLAITPQGIFDIDYLTCRVIPVEYMEKQGINKDWLGR